MKKAVICTDFGGMKEIVIHGETGFIVKSGNEKELAEKISILIQNNELAVEMGQKGFKRFEEKFSSEIMCEGHLQIANI